MIEKRLITVGGNLGFLETLQSGCVFHPFYENTLELYPHRTHHHCVNERAPQQFVSFVDGRTKGLAGPAVYMAQRMAPFQRQLTSLYNAYLMTDSPQEFIDFLQPPGSPASSAQRLALFCRQLTICYKSLFRLFFSLVGFLRAFLLLMEPSSQYIILEHGWLPIRDISLHEISSKGVHLVPQALGVTCQFLSDREHELVWGDSLAWFALMSSF